MSELKKGGRATLLEPICSGKFWIVEEMQLVKKKKGVPAEEKLVKRETNVHVEAGKEVNVIDYWDNMAIVEYKGERYPVRIEKLKGI